MKAVLVVLFAFAFALASADVDEKNAAGCAICELLVKAIKEAIDNNEDDIEALLNRFCNRLGPVAQTCHKFVNNYLKAIIDLLEQGIKPEAVCARIDLCPRLQVQDRIPGLCNLCKKGFDLGSKYCNPTSCLPKDQLLVKLNGEVCDQAPWGIQGICKKYMTAHIDEIYPIAHEFDKTSEEKCNELGNVC